MKWLYLPLSCSPQRQRLVASSLSEASAQNRKHTYHKTQFTDYIQIVMKSNPEELLEPARRVFTKEGREPRSSKLEK